MVAWCTKEGRGTRHIPAGALTGVQFTKTPHYIQVVGWLDQAALNIQADDSGGEMDPHGADQVCWLHFARVTQLVLTMYPSRSPARQPPRRTPVLALAR